MLFIYINLLYQKHVKNNNVYFAFFQFFFLTYNFNMVSEAINSMASAGPSSTGSNIDSLFLHPIKLELTIKLNHNNYLLWCQEVAIAIKGNRLEHFIDSIVPSPSMKFLKNGSNKIKFFYVDYFPMLDKTYFNN